MTDLGIFGGGQPSASSGGLNLGRTGAPSFSQQSPSPFFAGSQAPQQSGFQGMFGQQGQQFMQQPIAPPSEMEIQLAILNSLAPIEKFIASAQMGILIELLSNLITLSTVEVLRNAKFAINEDDGVMSLDVTSLPQNLQTISAENVRAQFGSLQSSAQEVVNNSQQTQEGLKAFTQQNMMGGALEAALANDGFMDKMGTTAGSFMGKMIGTR